MANLKTKTNPSSSRADVTPPGQSAPSPNSKSIIISNHPVLQDPMVVADSSTQSEHAAETLAPPSSTRLVIQPLNAIVPEDTPPVPPTETNPPKTEDVSDKLVIPIPEAYKYEPEPPSPQQEDAPSDKIATDETTPSTTPTSVPEPSAPTLVVATQTDVAPAVTAGSPAAGHMITDIKASSPAEQAELTLAEVTSIEAKHAQEVQALLDSKEYFLPINASSVQRTKRMIILGVFLSIILIAAWIDVALDAGLIHIQGVAPVTHFFSK